jgi:hypothetical protein
MKLSLLVFALALLAMSGCSSDRAAGGYDDHPATVGVGSSARTSAVNSLSVGSASASYFVEVQPADAVPPNFPPKPAKEVADKLRPLEMRLAADKGPFEFFALFLRQDLDNKWDLLVAAPWLQADKSASLQFLVNQVRSLLAPDELVLLSRAILVEDSDPTYGPAKQAIQQTMKFSHFSCTIDHSLICGVRINYAYVITSQKRLQTN